MAPLNKLPLLSLLTLPVVKELIVVEPLTVNLVTVVVAKVEVPVTDKVPEKEGLLDTAIVEVPENVMLLPGLKKEIGLL